MGRGQGEQQPRAAHAIERPQTADDGAVLRADLAKIGEQPSRRGENGQPRTTPGTPRRRLAARDWASRAPGPILHRFAPGSHRYRPWPAPMSAAGGPSTSTLKGAASVTQDHLVLPGVMMVPQRVEGAQQRVQLRRARVGVAVGLGRLDFRFRFDIGRLDVESALTMRASRSAAERISAASRRPTAVCWVAIVSRSARIRSTVAARVDGRQGQPLDTDLQDAYPVGGEQLLADLLAQVRLQILDAHIACVRVDETRQIVAGGGGFEQRADECTDLPSGLIRLILHGAH